MSVRKALLNAIRHVSTQMDHTIVHVYVVTSVMISQNVKVILGRKTCSFHFNYIPYLQHFFTCPKILMSVVHFLMVYVSKIVSTHLGHISVNAEMVLGVLDSIFVKVKSVYMYTFCRSMFQLDESLTKSCKHLLSLKCRYR